MGYNSKEEKEKAESLALKSENILSIFRDKKNQKAIMDSLELLLPAVTKLHEKSKHEPLSTQEQELIEEMLPAFELLLQAVSDAKLLLGHEIVGQTTEYFFHLKKLAEEGNEEARKAYEALAPSFRKSIQPDIDGPLGLN